MFTIAEFFKRDLDRERRRSKVCHEASYGLQAKYAPQANHSCTRAWKRHKWLEQKRHLPAGAMDEMRPLMMA